MQCAAEGAEEILRRWGIEQFGKSQETSRFQGFDSFEIHLDITPRSWDSCVRSPVFRMRRPRLHTVDYKTTCITILTKQRKSGIL